MTACMQTNEAGSPGVEDVASVIQIERRAFATPLPDVFSKGILSVQPVDPEILVNEQDRANNAPFVVDEKDADILKKLFPSIYDTPFFCFVNEKESGALNPINVGVVLSGGQAAGGHNVICGVYDRVKKLHKDSKVYGFIGGPHGVFCGEFEELTDKKIDQYRNMGGFDMIKSGRHKIETDAQKKSSLDCCNKLKLDGLVVIGGDDSNTNAAILAEYFKANNCSTCVIGCPKTIDGDLKNMFVEISFGFDTACRTYINAIGGLMSEALTEGDVYQFIRLMGRSASLICLECALQTHPNLAFIGEEVEARKLSLNELVTQVADLVEERAKNGKNYGVILLPEGLIEFIPEVGMLISEINHIVAHGAFEKGKLSPASQNVFDSLPSTTQRQLLLDRDPHGNVQVALIHTEKLLLEMAAEELKRRKSNIAFKGKCFYFGYEGRSGFPSDFDATYCYGLGNVAASLISNKVTGCMAVLKNMSGGVDVASWIPAGIPLTRMMNLETRKGKNNVPVIKKFLVDIDRPCFKAFEQVRNSWKLQDFYKMHGPMQLYEKKPELPFTLTGPPPLSVLCPTIESGNEDSFRQAYFGGFADLRSKLQVSRSAVHPEIPSTFAAADTVIVCKTASPNKLLNDDMLNTVTTLFPKTSQGLKIWDCTVQKSQLAKVHGGVVLIGEAQPGFNNVMCGFSERILAAGGEVFGFHGASGLMNGSFVKMSECRKDLSMMLNMEGFPFLGRTAAAEAQLASEAGMTKMASVLETQKIGVLLVLGASFLAATTINEFVQCKGMGTYVINVGGSSDFVSESPEMWCNVVEKISGAKVSFDSLTPGFLDKTKQSIVSDASGMYSLGFDSLTKAASELVGRVGGSRGVEVEVAYQTHANICISSKSWASKSLKDLVNYVASAVISRCGARKNFGLLVINDDFLLSNKELRSLALALYQENGSPAKLPGNQAEIFTYLPSTYQNIMVNTFNGSGSFTIQAKHFPFQECLAALVSEEFNRRKTESNVSGSFAPICFELIDQVRGTLPSVYDCSVGYSLGIFAGCYALNPNEKSNGIALMIKNPLSDPQSFEPLPVPLAAASSVFGLKLATKSCCENLTAMAKSGAFDIQLRSPTMNKAEKLDDGMKVWLLKDIYVNSGPILFTKKNTASHERNRNFLMTRVALE